MFRKLIAAPAVAVLLLSGLAACGSSSGTNSSFCKDLRGYASKGESVFPTGASDSEKYQQAVEAMKKLQKKAPKELKDDIGLFIQAAEKLQAGDLQALTDPEFSSKLQAALSNFEQYSTKVCKTKAPNREGG